MERNEQVESVPFKKEVSAGRRPGEVSMSWPRVKERLEARSAGLQEVAKKMSEEEGLKDAG